MTLEESLYARLNGYAGLTALVAARIYPMSMEQNPTLPLVTYRRIGGTPDQKFGGTAGIGNPVFSVTSWGETYKSARATAAQVRAALNVSMAALGGSGGVNAQIERITEGIDLKDPDTGWYYIPEDYVIHVQE